MGVLEILKAILYGIVEGITEWLPISSTGHMILLQEFVKIKPASFWNMFLVVIQLGAIMAVVVLYFNKLNPFARNKTELQKKDTLSLWGKVIVASIPAGVLGILFNEKIEKLFYNDYRIVAAMLIVYGVLFILVENRNRHRVPAVTKLNGLSYKTAFIIGIFQALALIPGTSRSGATILGAILIGTSRGLAAEFTFFLAIPAMFGGSVIKMVHFGLAYTPMEVAVLLTAVVVAFFVSIVSIRFLVGYIKKHNFKPFGYYRIILGIVVLVYFSVAAVQ